MTTTNTIEQTQRPLALIGVSDTTPPITCPSDAEVDIEVLKTVPKQFCIEDEKSANWLVKRVVAART